MFTTILTLNNLITNKPKSIYQDLGLFVFVQHGLYGILTKKTSKPVINYSAIYERFIPQISDTCHTDCQPSQYQANGRYNKAQHHQHKYQFYHTPKAITTPSVSKLNTASIAVPSQPNTPNTTNSTMPATIINMNVNI